MWYSYPDESDINFYPMGMNRGYNIGIRLIEDFLARSGLGKCADFKEVGEVVAKVNFSTLLKPYTKRSNSK
jgi:trafficking protein particle complex subunit 3